MANMTESPVKYDLGGVTTLSLPKPEALPSCWITAPDTTHFIKPFRRHLQFIQCDVVFKKLLECSIEVARASMEQHGIHYHGKDGHRWSHAAAAAARLDVLQLVVKIGGSITQVTQNKMTVLHVATLTNHAGIVSWLLDQGSDLNMADATGTTCLMISAFEGYTGIMQLLLNHGAIVNVRDTLGCTPLMAAAQQGHDEAVTLLLHAGADRCLTTGTGHSALFFACMKQRRTVTQLLLQNQSFSDHKQLLLWCALKGDLEIVRVLMGSRHNIDYQDSDGRTALMASSQGGHLDIFHFLIDHGEDVNTISNSGETALHFAAFHNQCRILEVLTGLTEDLDCVDENGNTSLMYGCLQGYIDVVKLLVASSVNVNVQNNKGKTALVITAESGHVDVMQALIQSEALPQIQTFDGFKALDIARLFGHSEIVKLLNGEPGINNREPCTNLLVPIVMGDISIVEELKDTDIANQDGVTALMLSALHGHVTLVENLLAKGAQVNVQNSYGRTAFAYAIAGSHMTIVDILLGRGASFDETDSQGETMLYHAASIGSVSTVDYLAKLGTDVNGKNRNGKTPLMVAAENGHISTVQYLIEACADLSARCENGMTASDYAFIANNVQICTILADELKKKDTEMNDDLGHRFVAASHTGNIDNVRYLLNTGVSVNARDYKNDGTTALYQAVVKSHLDITELLLSYGADIHCKSFNGLDSLLAASLHGRTAAVEQLLQHGANVNVRNNWNHTPLMFAAQEGHSAIAQMLIERHALTNVRDIQHGVCALTLAVTTGLIVIVDMLLEGNAYVDNMNFESRTPLFIASLRGHLSTVDRLVQANADVNIPDNHGRTPLMVAAQEGHLSVIQFLVEHGALVDMVSHDGATAHDLAQAKQQYDVANWLAQHGAQVGQVRTRKSRRSRIIDLSSEQISSVLEKPAKGAVMQSGTAQKELQDMCLNGWGFADTISYAINQGANVNFMYEGRKTALHLAAENNLTNHVGWLVKYGADVNLQNIEGRSALTYAVCQANMEMIQLLLQHNADVTVTDTHGKNLLAYAVESDNQELVEFVSNLLGLEDSTVHSATTQGQLLVNAVRRGNLEDVKQLLLQDSSVLQHADWGYQALLSCTRLFGETGASMLHLLHNCGADLNCVNQDNNSLLLQSITMNNVVMVTTLLTLGAAGLNCSLLCETLLQTSVEMTSVLLQNMNDLDVPSTNIMLNFVACNNDTELLTRLFSNTPALLLDHCGCETILIGLLERGDVDDCLLRQFIPHIDVEALVSSILTYDSVSGEEILLRLPALHPLSDTLSQQTLGVALEQGHYKLASALSSHVPPSDYVICSVSMQQTTPQKCDSHDAVTWGLKESAQVDIMDDVRLTGLHMDQLMDKIYNRFTCKLIREGPAYIRGFSRDRQVPKIYLYVKEGAIPEAQSFITDRITQEEPFMSMLAFEYITQTEGARFLMMDQGHSSGSDAPAEPRLTRRLQTGSLIFEKDTTRFGSIGCLMYEHGSAQNMVWAVTAAHTFLPDYRDNPNRTVTGQDSCLMSRFTSIDPPPIQDHQVGEKYWAAMENSATDNHFIDVALIPLKTEFVTRDGYNMSIPGLPQIPDIYRAGDQHLLGKKVAKTGAVTGHTQGVVVEVCVAYRIEGRLRAGLFAVIGEGGVFARPGDSGALITRPRTSQALGILSAVYLGNLTLQGRQYKDVAFCVRLDHCLQYAEQRWEKVLSFNRATPPLIPPVQEVPAQRPPGMMERTEQFIKEATDFAHQHVILTDTVELLNRQLDMHRQARKQTDSELVLLQRLNEDMKRKLTHRHQEVQEDPIPDEPVPPNPVPDEPVPQNPLPDEPVPQNPLPDESISSESTSSESICSESTS